MATSIFISYRRVDTEHAGGRLFQRLERDFYRGEIAMDIMTLKPGQDFVAALNDQLSACVVMLVLIGQKWLAASNDAGNRRLDDPEDIVRLEVATALERGIRVIPVLVDAAPMPASHQLPVPLQPLSSKQSVPLRHATFDTDADVLVQAIKSYGVPGRMMPLTVSGPSDPTDARAMDRSATTSSTREGFSSSLVRKPSFLIEFALIALVFGCLVMKHTAGQVDAYFADLGSSAAKSAFDVSIAVSFGIVFLTLCLLPVYVTSALLANNRDVIHVLGVVGATKELIRVEIAKCLLRMLIVPVIVGTVFSVALYLVAVEFLHLFTPALSRQSFWLDLIYVLFGVFLFAIVTLIVSVWKTENAIAASDEMWPGFGGPV